MNFARLIVLLLSTMVLQACVGIPSKPINSAATLALHQQHLEDIAKIQQFTLKGRIGVQADGKGFSGGVSWQHLPANDEVSLYSPLGGQVAHIQKNADRVSLTDAKGNNITATDTESLTQQTLGWKLPLAGLADWSLGRPTTSAIQASTWDDSGYLSTLKQDGWEVEYQSYALQHGYFLPSKIVLRNDKVHLKLLVEEWNPVAN